MTRHDRLAIEGGAPVRRRPMPGRRLFGEAELAAVRAVFEAGWQRDRDFGFQQEAEDRYCEAFTAFQGGGFADAVSSGTAALLVCLAALDLPAGSATVFSPVTDPGGITPALFLGHRPVLVDAGADSFRMNPAAFEQALTPDTRAAVITHPGGIPVDLGPIVAAARRRGIYLVEDCSQAHGAEYRGRKVGTFGDAAFFSTMFSKNHASGGCGGLVYTASADLYRRVRSLADRGKPFGHAGFDPKDPRGFLWPALNLNQDELSCAIGRSTLARLETTNCRRRAIVAAIAAGLRLSQVLYVPDWPADCRPAPFFLTIGVRAERLRVGKTAFARAVAAEGIDVNPDYRYVAAEWPWLAGCCDAPPATPNATAWRRRSFNLLFHERYTDGDVADILAALAKVEAAYGR